MQNATGRQVSRLRSAQKPKMTQADLAHALQLRGFNIDRAGVAKIERGYRQVSDVELVLIAEVFGVPPGDFFEGTEGLGQS